MTTRTVLRGADIVGPDRVVSDGALVIEDGLIADVLEAVPPLAGDAVRWVRGIVAPAFVDLHSDAVERELRPRPTAPMPPELALAEFDRRLAAHGIGTVLHAIAVTEEEGARSEREARQLAAAIAGRRDACLVRHRLHARYEITDVHAAATVHRLLEDGHLVLISFMDHTPGGRQFKRREDYVAYFSRAYGLSDARIDRLVEEKLRRKRDEMDVLGDALASLARAARARGIALASHDDDSADDIAWAVGLGVTIAEFPVTAEAAAAAKSAGLHVVMGAPNIVRGGSTGGNLPALDALRMGALDSLCSDYYPAAMLHAAMRLVDDGHAGLAEAFRLITFNPARALGLQGESGSIEPGQRADLVVIDRRDGVAVVTRMLRDGREVLAAQYPEREPARPVHDRPTA
jgi:alpha-D-ribose 1-methylphosphonate 5-triphosphate diphosphatase